MEMDFYEKPGCINGEKQKVILKNGGNSLHCINILTYPWTKEALLPFISGKSPEQMMNSTAPAIKNGEIVPQELETTEAVRLMVADPILIKRPLIAVDNLFIQGFEDARLRPYLGGWNGEEDVVTCPNLRSLSCDEKKE